MIGTRACRNCGGALPRRARACVVCLWTTPHLTASTRRWLLLIVAVLITVIVAR